MTTNDLTAWLGRFQTELRDDITNGAHFDYTRKPGFYYICENVTYRRPDECTPDIEDLFWHIKHHEDLLARAAYHADREEHGLETQCGRGWHATEYCECEPWNFTSIEDAAKAVAKDFDAVEESLCIRNEDDFYAWASTLPELEHLFYEERLEHRLDHVFLTRKSGERHATRHKHRYIQPTVCVHCVDESNPDLLNAIRFLAALDLEKSHLILNQEQQ